MAGIDIISDSTGKEIVAAIQSTDVAQARILEINTAAEAKKNEVLESIPEDYSNISKEVDEIKGKLNNLNLFKNYNDGWLYFWNENTQTMEKFVNASFGQTAPIKVYPNQRIIIYGVTSNNDNYTVTRLGSNDIDDVIDGKVSTPISVDGMSYYVYEVPDGTEWISVGFVKANLNYIFIGCENSIKMEDAESRILTEPNNYFRSDNYYSGWLYVKSGSEVKKETHPSLGQTYVYKVNSGEILNIYGTTPNTDNFWVAFHSSMDIDDVTNAVEIKPIKSINGKSYARFVVPANVSYLSVGLVKKNLDYINIHRSTLESKESFVTVNALGDSITEGFIRSVDNTPQFAEPTWCTTVANNLGCTVNNYGVSATSICDGSSESFLARLNRMSEAWIDCLVIFGGTNDYGDKRARTLGSITDTPAQGTNFYASFKNLVETAITKYPMAQILIITPMRRQYGETNEYGISIEDIVNAEIEVAEYYGVECFDFFHRGGINPKFATQRTAYTSDGLHPNQNGINRFLAPRFTMAIKNVISCRG